MDKKSLDHLKYGEPTRKHLKKMSRDTPMIGISFEQIYVKPPPKNSSNETLAELRHLVKSTSGSENVEEFIRLADEKPLKVFESFANENNLSFDKVFLEQVKRELASFILNLKYKFNRPRPFQIARVLNIDLNGLHLETANTPAYPSGHAIQAHVISNILSRLNPKFERSLENLAEKISLSRMQSGVHYPSDLQAGKDIAYKIERHISIPSQHRGLAMENSVRKIIKEFITESYDEGPQKLRVLDFDDTIANTVERVLITQADGTHKPISSSEFAVYELQPGESIDPNVAFREFSRVDSERATPVPLISKMLRSFASAPGDRKLLILTARSQEVADDVMKFLENNLGIDDPYGKIDFVGVESKEPMAKVNEIEHIMRKHPTINFVSFYDDSGKNVRAVNNFLDQQGFSRGRDQRDVRQVIHLPDGSVKLVNLDDESSVDESADLRKMTKRFLMML